MMVGVKEQEDQVGQEGAKENERFNINLRKLKGGE